MRVLNLRLPALSSRTRRGLLFVAATLLGLWIVQTAVGLAMAGLAPAVSVTPDAADVSIVMPSTADVRGDIRRDPFVDSVDVASKATFNGPLAGMNSDGNLSGVPDISPGQPIAGGIGVGPSSVDAARQIMLPQNAINHGEPAYVGRISAPIGRQSKLGVIAVVVWSDGFTKSVIPGDPTPSGVVVSTSMDAVVFSSGKRLAFSPRMVQRAVGAANSAAPPTRGPVVSPAEQSGLPGTGDVLPPQFSQPHGTSTSSGSFNAPHPVPTVPNTQPIPVPTMSVPVPSGGQQKPSPTFVGGSSPQ